MYAISDQREQGVGSFIDDNKPVLILKFRSKADLCKIRAPVGRQLRLFKVEPSFSAIKVEGVLISPEWRVGLKSVLPNKK